MPVTAKLSSRFYEKLGDDVTNKLVTWLNAVDAEFRNQLREANDRNWDRFRTEFAASSATLSGEFKSGLSVLRAELLVEIHQESTKLLRWMFAFWVMTVLSVAGLKVL